MSDLQLAQTPGEAWVCAMMGIPFEYEEAERMGMYEEDAISFHDAMDAVDMTMAA